MTDPVKVEGLKELRRSLRQVSGPEAGKAIQRANKAAAEVVAAAARQRVPVRTGRARSTVRATATQSVASVKFGGARAPYAPWLDYGGRVGRNKTTVRPFKRGGRIIYPALDAERPQVIATYERELDNLLTRFGGM